MKQKSTSAGHISHMAQVRGQYAYNRAQVRWLTGMSDDALSAFQFEEGLCWIEGYTGGDEETAAALMADPVIWKWWLNEWNRRDDTVILPALYRMDADAFIRKTSYASLHSAIYIQHSPPYVLLAQSFRKLKTCNHDYRKN